MRHVLLLMALAICPLFGLAQGYVVSPLNVGAGNPGGLNTDSDFSTTGWNSILGPSLNSNQWSAPVSIPFPFEFNGQPATQIKASGNGLVTFDAGATALPNANTSLPAAGLPDSTVAVQWYSFTSSPPTGTNDEVYTKTFGTPGNRQFWIRWHSFEIGDPNFSFNYFALVLEEGTNNIYCVAMYSGTSTDNATVGIQVDGTTAFEATTTYSSPGLGSGTTDNEYWVFSPALSDDAGVSALNAPSFPVSPGMQPVDVELENFGANPLNSVDIEWEIDGVAQTTVNYTTTLAPFSSTNVNLGMFNFPTGTSTIRAWTTNPNGGTDPQNSNDTLEVEVCTPYNGAYTVGGTTPDFNNLEEAFNALETCGVTGPVELNVEPGVYTEQVEITEIPGASMMNQITVNGADTSLVFITPDNSLRNAAILFDGADWITFKNVTVGDTTLGSEFFAFQFRNLAEHNTLDSVRVVLLPTTGFDYSAVVASDDVDNDFGEGDNFNYLTIRNSHLFGGEYNINLDGNGSDFTNNHNIIIENNLLEATDDGCIRMDNQDTIRIVGNTMDALDPGADGIYIFDVQNFEIEENSIQADGEALYISDGNFDEPTTSRSRVVNNMLASNNNAAVDFDDTEEVDFWHNSMWSATDFAMEANDIVNFDIRNNLFTSADDFVIDFFDGATGITTLDYNSYFNYAGNDIVDFGGTTYASVLAWQLGEPTYNQNSVEEDPAFVNPPADLHALSPGVNDIGDNSVGITVDIDGDTRPFAGSTIVDLGADEFDVIDTSVVAVNLMPDGSFCGDSNTVVMVELSSLGVDTLFSVPFTWEVNGPGGVTIQNPTINDTLVFSEDKTFNIDTLDTYEGGSWTLTFILDVPNDPDNTDDTLTTTFSTTPFEPMPENDTVMACSGSDAMLVAMDLSGIEYGWYSDSTGTNQLALNDTLMYTPTQAVDTVYLKYETTADSLETTFAAGNTCGGGNMFDITAINDVNINGFTINPEVTATGQPLNVYYIPNGTYVGNQTNSGAWTLLGNYTFDGTADVPEFVPVANLTIPAGQTYAIYVEYDANYTNGSTTYSNADMEVTTGDGLCSAFGGVNTGREFNGRIHYGSVGCSSVLTPVTVMEQDTADASFMAMDDLLDVDFDASASMGDSLMWDLGDGTMTNDTVFTHTYATAGDYTVQLVAYSPCGNDTATQVITVCDSLAISIDTTQTGPLDFDFGVSGQGNPVTVTWDFGDGSPTVQMMNPSHTFPAPGNYTVQAIAEDTCGNLDTTDIEVSACQPLVASYSHIDGPLPGEKEFTFNGSGNPVEYIWDFDDGNDTTTTGGSVAHIYTGNGDYDASLTVVNACGDSATYTETITVIITSSANQLTEELGLNIYPNPADGFVNVDFSATAAGQYNIAVFDLTGRQVMQRTQSLTANEAYSTKLQLGNLSAGTYNLRITGPTGQLTNAKLILR